MASLPPLNALRAFEAAARRGSFAAAAEELNVTPAAIGQQVRQLEALIGAPLFVREGRGLKLSERGAAAIDRLSRAFELVGEASSAMREAGASAALTLSAPSDFASAWLAPRLARRRPDGLRITLLASPPETAFEAGAEIAVVFAAEPPAGFEALLLMREILAPLARPDIARTLRTPGDLDRAVLIEEAGLQTGWRTWLAARGAYGVDPAAALRTGDGLSALALAEAGAGVALARRSLAAGAVAAGGLTPVFSDGDHPAGEAWYALTRRGRRLSAGARDTLSWLRAEAAAHFDAADEL